MIPLALAISLLAPQACPATDPETDLLALHETTRRAHLRGDAALIAGTLGDRLLMAEKGVIRTQSRTEVAAFFTTYLKRVRYSEWKDASPPVVRVSPDARMAWMAVEIAARYALADGPTGPEKSFKSSWIATYERQGCDWRMTGIASDVVE